mgnify:CR=1 FL=1
MFAAFDTNHPAMHDYVLLKIELKRSRAALKAQPAPTEAFGKPFDPKDETIKRLQGLIAAYEQIIAGHEARDKRAIKYANSAQIAPTEAQGEDSARLALMEMPAMNPECGCQECNLQMIGRMMFICKLCGDKRCPHVANHVNPCQDRARASAETGGVNVQPPYPEGDVVGACVCGSWPGGKCLKCPWIPAETGGVKS